MVAGSSTSARLVDTLHAVARSALAGGGPYRVDRRRGDDGSCRRCTPSCPALHKSCRRPQSSASAVTTPIEQFEIAGIPHVHAFDRGGWLLLAAVAISSSAGLWKRRGRLASHRARVCRDGDVPAARRAMGIASRRRIGAALVSAGLFAASSVVSWIVQRSHSADDANANTT